MTPEQRTRKNARSAERMRQLRADPVWREEFNRRRREDPVARARDAERSLRYNYGLTSEQYAAMFASQGGLCAVCRGRGGKKGLVVDHCHETGVVRGSYATAATSGSERWETRQQHCAALSST